VAVRTPVVRTMTTADIAAVAELEVVAFKDPWPPSFFFEELAAPGRDYVVVEEVGGIVAYGGSMVIDADAHIMTIAVRAEARRRRLGTRVLAALIEAAIERGAEHLTLEVRESNAAAIALYRQFGFVAAGRRPRYYADEEDAVVMWAHDVASAEARQARAAMVEP
jgi:ribosomal-protein-alanine N-acetyltransferase